MNKITAVVNGIAMAVLTATILYYVIIPAIDNSLSKTIVFSRTEMDGNTFYCGENLKDYYVYRFYAFNNSTQKWDRLNEDLAQIYDNSKIAISIDVLADENYTLFKLILYATVNATASVKQPQTFYIINHYI